MVPRYLLQTGTAVLTHYGSSYYGSKCCGDEVTVVDEPDWRGSVVGLISERTVDP